MPRITDILAPTEGGLDAADPVPVVGRVEPTPAPWVVELPTGYEEDGCPPIGHPDCREHFCIRKGTALRSDTGDEPGIYNTGDLIMLLEDCTPDNIQGRILADGYLIAAAPDLLAALIDCLDHCMLDWTSDDPRAVRARASIAKARGEQP